MMIPLLALLKSTAGASPPTVTAVYDTADPDGIDTEGSVALADGIKIAGLADVNGSEHHAVQATSANRPLVENDLTAGRWTAQFDGLKHLKSPAPNGAPDLHIFLVVRAGANGPRIMWTIDTTATTTKAAGEIAVG